MPDLVNAVTDTAVHAGPTPSAQGWFAGGERVGYDPRARAIVAAQDAPLKIFLRREGDLAHAISFLPGFPDGSFGWAKVQPHLPNAPEMPKLFVEYVGMGDNDKPKDYAYSTAERTDLVEGRSDDYARSGASPTISGPNSSRSCLLKNRLEPMGGRLFPSAKSWTVSCTCSAQAASGRPCR